MPALQFILINESGKRKRLYNGLRQTPPDVTTKILALPSFDKQLEAYFKWIDSQTFSDYIKSEHKEDVLNLIQENKDKGYKVEFDETVKFENREGVIEIVPNKDHLHGVFDSKINTEAELERQLPSEPIVLYPVKEMSIKKMILVSSLILLFICTPIFLSQKLDYALIVSSNILYLLIAGNVALYKSQNKTRDFTIVSLFCLGVLCVLWNLLPIHIALNCSMLIYTSFSCAYIIAAYPPTRNGRKMLTNPAWYNYVMLISQSLRYTSAFLMLYLGVYMATHVLMIHSPYFK